MSIERFLADTAVQELPGGRFQGDMTDRWSVLTGGLNGGYVLALAARAMREVAGRPDPVTITAHYMHPSLPGPVDITTQLVKHGRAFTTIQASLRQGDRECMRAIGAFKDLSIREGPTRVDRRPPTLPPIDQCVDVNTEVDRYLASYPGESAPEILRRFDYRCPPEFIGCFSGEPSGVGEVGGYSRFARSEFMDTLGLLAVADSYPPPVFAGVAAGWVPTIEMTIQVRKRPAPGWLTSWFTTTAVTDGLLEEDGEIWDSDGDLVALSRQLAMVR